MYYYFATYDFASLPYQQKAERGFWVGSCLEGHTLFTTPPTSAANIKTLSETLKTCYVNYQSTHSEEDELALIAADDELTLKLKGDADYVTMKSEGNAELIRSGGFTPSKEREISEKPPYEVSAGSKAGSVALYYQKGTNDKGVVWLKYPGKEAPEDFDLYKFCAGTTKDKINKGGFSSGTWWVFIAGAISTNSEEGTCEWSPPMVQLIP